jgi:uncharacterized cupredoxin-like copper-binding protein
LLAVALLLVACAQDDPTLGGSPHPLPSSAIGVTALEYEFQGMPEVMQQGEETFVLNNGGEEPHELYLAYITSDQSIEEIIELPEKQVNKVTQAVDRVEAAPGESAEFTAALVPGRFGYVCFVQAPDGTPHAFLGMAGELTVA